MTGRDLIQFIKENKLENTEVLFNSAMQPGFQFGNWTIQNGEPDDGIMYSIYHDLTQGITTEIELFLYHDGNPETRLLTPEEGIKLRKAM